MRSTRRGRLRVADSVVPLVHEVPDAQAMEKAIPVSCRALQIEISRHAPWPSGRGSGSDEGATARRPGSRPFFRNLQEPVLPVEKLPIMVVDLLHDHAKATRKRLPILFPRRP